MKVVLPSVTFFAALTPEMRPVIRVAAALLPSGVLSPDMRMLPATSTVPSSAIFVGKEAFTFPSLRIVITPAAGAPGVPSASKVDEVALYVPAHRATPSVPLSELPLQPTIDKVNAAAKIFLAIFMACCRD